MELFVLAIVFFVAGIIPELTGFGVATVSMALLPFALPFEIVLPLVTIMSVITTGIVTIQSKTDGTLKRIFPLVLGSAMGVYLGMYFLSNLDINKLMKAFGLFLILYSIYGLAMKKEIIHFEKKIAVIVGFAAGFFSAAFNIHGPLVGMYESSDYHLTKRQVLNTISSYIFFTGIFTFIGHLYANRVTPVVVQYSLFSLPFLIIGLYVGTKLFGRLKVKIIKHLVYILALIIGVILLTRG